jgi:polar amino acid transport system substrate-binding protein
VSPHQSTPPASSGGKKLPLPLLTVFLVVAFVGGLLLATWYFQYKLQQATTPKPVAKTTATAVAKTLIIGSDATAPPMESVNKQGGLVGYDIDLAYRLGNEMGMKVEIKNISWDDVFKALENKKIDMIISSVTINDERKQKYAFSDPYINAGQVIVSRKDSPITSTAQLKGKKISVQKGTTCEQEALKYTAPNLVISYDQFIDAATAVSNGTTDATICDLTLAKGFVNKYDNLKITSDPFTNEYYGVVLRKDNTDLLKKVNDALSVLRVKGILTDLKQKWLD